MQKTFALFYFLLIAITTDMAAAQSLATKGASKFSGTYDAFQPRVTGFSMRSDGENFLISAVGQSWAGRGRTEDQTVQNFTRQSPVRQLQAATATQTCINQANQCHSCPNGRATIGGACVFENVAACREHVLTLCKANPSSGEALSVKRGKLTNAQVRELWMSCPNIPHSSLLPYNGPPPPPGSKKMEQCKGFEKTYYACMFLFHGFERDISEKRGRCLRETYTGP
jgi:hypothetical protein